MSLAYSDRQFYLQINNERFLAGGTIKPVKLEGETSLKTWAKALKCIFPIDDILQVGGVIGNIPLSSPAHCRFLPD